MTDQEFEMIGAAEVRARLVTNVYSGATRAAALACLERRSERGLQLDIARSAKDAAWAAARAAGMANSKETTAIAIAIISLVVAGRPINRQRWRACGQPARRAHVHPDRKDPQSGKRKLRRWQLGRTLRVILVG